MKTLEDAWRWYQDAQSALRLINRLGSKHWPKFPWADPTFTLLADDHFRMLEQPEITEPATNALNHLDDLAIVVMFSVFEAVVRDNVLGQIKPELATLQHHSLKEAADDLAETIRVGSFHRVLAPFRSQAPGLTEEVDQVRDYRNCVAHGNRKAVKNAVTPEVAYDRLKRFLEKFCNPVTISEEDWLMMLREAGE